MRTTISTTISEATRRQIDELAEAQGYSIRDIITVAVDRMHRQEGDMAKFYVVQKSNWQGDRWTPVAGPFPTRTEAEADPASTKTTTDIPARAWLLLVEVARSAWREPSPASSITTVPEGINSEAR